MALSRARSGRALAVALSASLIAVTLTLVSLGCDPGHDVTYDNRTNERLSVYRFGRYDFTLEPLQKATYGVFEFAGDMALEAKDDNGNVVYSRAFTWEELKQLNWEVVITDTGQMPPASPTPTAPASSG